MMFGGRVGSRVVCQLIQEMFVKIAATIPPRLLFIVS